MANQIEREVWVKQDKLKNPVHYVRGTDLLPIVFHFRDFSIPSGATARVFVAKPDGNAVYDSATIEGNDVTVDVTEQMFLVLGMTLMQISIFDGEEELVTFAQPVMVEHNLKAGDLPESTTDVSFLDDAIEQANQAVNTATTAASQAAQAVKNANQAIEDANDAISDLNAQIASLNTNFASLANNVGISQLDTTAKTLVNAINELNGNKIGVYAKNIQSISDVGTKSCFISTGADINVGDTVVPKYSKGVYSTNGGGDGSLIFFTPDNKICCLFKNTNVWGEAVYFSDDSSLFYGKRIQSGDNLNDYRTPGIYCSISSTVSNTLLNMPETLSAGFSLLVLQFSTGTVIQVIFKGTTSNAIYTRSITSSGWQSWYKYAGEKIEA